jgi:hypothetical protein
MFWTAHHWLQVELKSSTRVRIEAQNVPFAPRQMRQQSAGEPFAPLTILHERLCFYTIQIS